MALNRADRKSAGLYLLIAGGLTSPFWYHSVPQSGRWVLFAVAYFAFMRLVCMSVE